MSTLYFLLFLAGLVAFVLAAVGVRSARLDQVGLIGLGLALVTAVPVIEFLDAHL